MASIQDFYNLPKIQQAGILGGICVLIAIGIGYWAWQGLAKLGPDGEVPAFVRRPGNATALWRQIGETDKKIGDANAYIAKEPMIDAKLESLQDEIKVAKELLPKDKEKEEVREILQKYMREVPAEYGQVAYVRCSITERGSGGGRRGPAVGPGSEFKAIVYQTEIRASMEGLIAFIDAVETNSERFMIVERFDVAPGGVDVDEEAFELVYEPHAINLDIVTYVYEEAGQ